MKARTRAPLYLLTILAFSCLPIHGQDATQAPAGGIVSLDDAPLTVVREHIAISPERVFADYTLRNDTSSEITTNLAFIVPDYTLEFHRDAQGREAFDDVQIAVDGVPVALTTEVRGELHGHDCTHTLNHYKLDIASFGHFTNERSDLATLSSDQVDNLVRLGIYMRAAAMDHDPVPRWSVAKRYIHQQSFAPGVNVRVQLTYTPVPGSINSIQNHRPGGNRAQQRGTIDPAAALELRAVCASPELQARMQKFMATPPHNAGMTYVDFSLTGSHAWKTPAADFVLRVATPPSVKDISVVPSVCWSQSEPKQENTVWSAKTTDFTPSNDLRVGWFQLEGSEF